MKDISKNSFGLSLISLLLIIALLERTVFSGFLGDIKLNLEVVEILILFLIGSVFLRRLMARAKPNTRLLLPEKALVLFGCFCTFSFLLSIYSPPFVGYDLLNSMNIWRKYILCMVVPYFVVRENVTSSMEARKVFFVALTVCIALSALILLNNFNSPGSSVLEEGDVSGRIFFPLDFSISIGGNTTALYLLTPMLVSVSLLLIGDRVWVRLFGGILFSISFICLIFLATRATLILFPFNILLLLIILMHCRKRKNNWIPNTFYIWGFILILLTLLAIIKGHDIIKTLPRFQQEKIGSIFTGNQRTGGADTIAYRTDQYRVYSDLIIENPLGYGISTLYPQYFTQPHGLIISLLLRSGWGGLFSYVFFMVGIAGFWYRKLPTATSNTQPFLAGMIVLIVNLIIMSWGYDFMNRFGIQLTFTILCSLTSIMAKRRS